MRKKMPDFFPWNGVVTALVVIFIVLFVGSAFVR